jgi:hypothetical protein
LISYRGIRGIWQPLEFIYKNIEIARNGHLQEVAFEPPKFKCVDAHRRVPVSVSSKSPAYAVASKSNRIPPYIPDSGLIQEESMLTLGCKQHKKTLGTDVLNVGKSKPFPPYSRPFRNIDAVFVNDFGVHDVRVFSLGHRSSHVKPVAVSNVGNGELLNESLDACRLAPIQSGLPFEGAEIVLGTISKSTNP